MHLLQYRAHWELVVDGIWKSDRVETTDTEVYIAKIIFCISREKINFLPHECAGNL